MGIIDFIKGELHRDHRVDRRLARHAVVPLPGRRQGDQERRAAHRPRVAGGAVRLPRRVRRHVRAGQAHADHRQHPDPHAAEVVEVRLRVAVQGRRLLRQHAAVHRQQVGHVQPDHDARRRLRHRPRPRLRHLRLPDRRPEDSSCRRSPARTTTSGSTSSPTRCARASSASSATRWPSAKIPVLDVGDALHASWATRCCR